MITTITTITTTKITRPTLTPITSDITGVGVGIVWGSVAFWQERIKNISLNTVSPTSVSVEWIYAQKLTHHCRHRHSRRGRAWGGISVRSGCGPYVAVGDGCVSQSWVGSGRGQHSVISTSGRCVGSTVVWKCVDTMWSGLGRCLQDLILNLPIRNWNIFTCWDVGSVVDAIPKVCFISTLLLFSGSNRIE